MSSANPNDFAIVIGINDYGDPKRNLNSPVTDAKKISEWLCDPNGGGVDPSHCKLLLGDGSKEVAKDLIEDELIAAKKFSLNCKKEGRSARRLYFYFSGHGLSRQTDEVLMCHSLWNADRPNANINSSELEKSFFNSCTLFDEVVIWLDCCRNRNLIIKPGSLEVGCASARSDGALQKTMIAFATLDGSFAYDGINGGEENSVFTETLLVGLKLAGNGSGLVSWRSLSEYLYKNVSVVAENRRRKQLPQIDLLRLPEGQDLYFGPSSTNIPDVTIDFDLVSGDVNIFDQKFNIVVNKFDLSTGPLIRKFSIGPYLAITNNQNKSFIITGVEQRLKVNFNG